MATNTKPAERPIYGYLSAPDHADYDRRLEAILNRTYGRVGVRLKPSVRAKTSITIGDSLSQRRYVQASMAAKVDPKSIEVGGNGWNQIHIAIFEDNLPTDALRREIQDAVHYIEAQFHEGLSVDDILDVAFEHAPSIDAQNALKAKGIPWRVIP